MRTNRNQTLVFLIMIATLALTGMILPQRDFSARENRYLAKRPPLTLSGIGSGKFMAAYEDYTIDQFPGRDTWVLFKMDVERLLNKRESRHIYFGSEGQLLERYFLDEKWLEQNARYLKAFAEKTGLPTSLLLAPTAAHIYPERLPAGAPTDSQEAAKELVEQYLGETVQSVDLRAPLQVKKDEYIYFRTDHHWTMRGAYYAYVAWMEERGETPLPLGQMQSTVVSSDFLGTHYAKARRRRQEKDTIEVLSPKEPPLVSVFYADTNITARSLFDDSYLETVDQYSYFLGGNHGLLRIDSDLKNGKSLLVIKDSYAHSFLPFLVSHYETIHVLDLRYFADSPSAYAAAQGCDEVLFLFSIPQFGSAANLHRLR